MKREVPKVVEVVRVRGRKGTKSDVVILRYHPGFKEAYGIVSMDESAIEFSTFGDDSLNEKRLRKAWMDWEKHCDETPEEWSFKWAVGSFVRWLNSGGEARLAHAREARRHGHA